MSDEQQREDALIANWFGVEPLSTAPTPAPPSEPASQHPEPASWPACACP